MLRPFVIFKHFHGIQLTIKVLRMWTLIIYVFLFNTIELYIIYKKNISTYIYKYVEIFFFTF